MLQAIIFDMDGVLVDSIESNRASYEKFFAKYGIDIQKSSRKKYLWRALVDQLAMRKEEYHIQQDISLEDFRAETLGYQLAHMQQVLKPEPAVQKLIQEAKEKGIKIAVATSSSKIRAIKMLELVDVYTHLDAFVSCEDVEKSKPSPDIFLKAAEILGIEPKNCIVIEDAVNGIQAAISAWMKSAGKLWGDHTKEDFNMADMVFSSFDEISLNDIEKVFL